MIPRIFRSRRGQLAAGIIALLVVAGGAWAALGQQPVAVASPTPTASPTLEPTERPTQRPTASPRPTPAPAGYCPLNGLPVYDAGLIERMPLAIQIDNDPGARPGRNLNRADMVIEATVEGDVTRFTAIFLCQETEGLTGPIRSARYYNVDLWRDLGVLTIGFGASPGALDRFSAANMPYVNGITGAWPWFKRFGNHAAPHNLYGDVEAIRAALGSNAALDRLAANVHPLRPPLTFDPEAQLPDGRAVASVEIRTNPYWRIGWRWDATGKTWQRLDGGVETMDAASDEGVTATSVLVQRVTEEVVYGDPDPGGNPRRLHHLVGSGKGVLYVNGTAIDVAWSRASNDAGTTWTYADGGGPVVLPPGVVWWEIVPTQGTVSES